ncbi:MAG: hypothetical protein IIX61_10825 [Loktanella sp.]|nr:hypothetical protein [Loktanella sp.]
MNDILVPIAPADLFDRIIGLQLQLAATKDDAQRAILMGQSAVLNRLAARIMPASAEVTRLTTDLFAARQDLQHLVQDLQACEARNEYGASFVALSQSLLATVTGIDHTKAAINLHYAVINHPGATNAQHLI